MQYDKNLFGEGIKIYSHGTMSTGQILYDYTIGSQNANLSALFESGAVENNAPLPDNLFYWLIGKDSPYNQISFIHRTGTRPNYNYELINSEKNNKNVPIVLWGGYTKINPTTYDIDINSGSNLSNSANNCHLIYNTSTFNLTNSQTPLWEKNFGFSTSTHPNGKYSSLPFILDFDYNNFIFKIKVGGSQGYVDLANYNNNENNYINTIGIELNTGDVSTGNSRLERQARCDINGNNITYNMEAVNYPVTDFDFNIPEVYRQNNLYAYDRYRAISKLGSQTNHILFNGANVYTNYTNVTPSYFMDMDKWELVDNSYRLKKHGEGVYNEDDYNYIRKLVAWLGFWFTDGGMYTDSEHSYTLNRANALLGDNANTYAESYMIPDKVYQSEIKDGITTGKFTELRIAKDNDQSKWGKDWRDKNGYNGRDGSGENKDRGNLTTTRRNGTLPTNTKNYSISANDFNALCTWCNNGFQVTDNNQFLEDFKGLNPSECIISAMYFPFALLGSPSVTQIKIGNLTADNIGADKIDIRVNYGATGAPTTTSAPIKYVLNSGQPISREFNDFRDYAPYTTIDMYVPFCGSISLNPADIYDYPLTVEIIPDLLTGACVGCVYRGDYLLTTVDGQIGVPITLTLGQVGDYQNAITQAAFNLKNANRQMFSSWLGAVASVGAIASGNVLAGTAGLIGSGLSIINSQDNIKKAEYDLSHIPRNFNTVGSLSDSINVLTMPEYVHMIIKRPYNLQGADISQYAHTVGHACNKQGYVCDFSGYTLASDIDLSGISATADELEQIRKYFATGVYL